MDLKKMLLLFIIFALMQAKPTSRRMASRKGASAYSRSSYDSPSPNSYRRRSNNNADDGRVNSYLMKNNYNGYDDTVSRKRRRRGSRDIDTSRLRDMLDRKIANSVGQIFSGFDFSPVKNGLEQNKFWVSLITCCIGVIVFFVCFLRAQKQKQNLPMFNATLVKNIAIQNAKKSQDNMRRLRYIKQFGQLPDQKRWKIKNLKEIYE